MNLNFDLFKIEKNHQIPSKGKVLISEPFLSDHYFKRSVVLLTEHNDEGSVGFVLNKPVKIPFSEVVADFPEIDSSLSFGGPVNTNSLHYLHTYGEIVPESIEIISGLYWGGDFNAIKDIAKKKNFDKYSIRFFLGYSGWQPNQLLAELSENSWVVADIDHELIMKNDHPDMWKEILLKLGGQYSMWTKFPEDPNMN